MQTIETPPVEVNPEDQLSPKMKSIIYGPASDNYEFRQMQLIATMCIRDNHGETLTRSKLDDAGNRWADLEHPDSSYSKAWRDLVKSPQFQTHLRFQGNYANVSLDDLEKFIETGQLPE